MSSWDFGRYGNYGIEGDNACKYRRHSLTFGFSAPSPARTTAASPQFTVARNKRSDESMVSVCMKLNMLHSCLWSFRAPEALDQRRLTFWNDLPTAFRRSTRTHTARPWCGSGRSCRSPYSGPALCAFVAQGHTAAVWSAWTPFSWQPARLDFEHLTFSSNFYLTTV